MGQGNEKAFGLIKRTVLPKIKDMLFWGVVSDGDILIAKGYDDEAELLINGHVTYNDEEMSMKDWLKRITGKSLSQIRKEYVDENDEM